MKKIFVIVGAIVLILVGLLFKPSFKVSYESPTRYELLRLTNIEREKVGVDPLIEDIRLDQSAQIKTDDMVNNNYFGHISPNGKHGYEYVEDVAPGLCNVKAENLRENSSARFNTSKRTIDAFVASPKHYETMVNPKYSLVGFGIDGKVITVHFCEIVL
jgi:uncharacterized protein YkwD